MRFDFDGYHVEVSGNGYFLLVREEDDKVIARYEGDFYENETETITGNYKDSDFQALQYFFDWCQ